MKKIVIVLLNVFLIVSSVSSQIDRFNKMFDFYGYGDVCINVQETNYGYLLCGTVRDSNLRQCLGILLIDKAGNEIQKVKIDFLQQSYNLSKAQFNTYDSTFFLIGTITFPDMDIAAHLTKINQYGDTLWTKVITDTTYNCQGGAIYRENNGDLLIVGSTDRTDPNVNILLTKTDSLGNFIWDNEYGVLGTYDTGWSIDKCDNDSGYIIGGGKYYFGPQIVRSYIIKTDTIGDFQWNYEYGSNAHSNYTSKVLYTLNNQIISAAAKGFYTNINNDTYSKPNLLFLDSSGTLIAYKDCVIDSAAYIGFEDLYEINANEYLFTGTFSYNFDRRIGLLKTNAVGDTIFGRTYQGVNQWEFSADVKPTSDGGYIIAGFNYPGLNGVSQNFRVIKVDSLGCDVEDCSVGISENENTWNENENLLVFPNPSAGKFYLEIKNVPINPYFETKLEVYDVIGNLVFQSGNKLFQNLTEVDISNNPTGIYLIKVYFKGVSVGSIRVVKE